MAPDQAPAPTDKPTEPPEGAPPGAQQLSMESVQRGIEASLDLIKNGDSVRSKYHSGRELYVAETVLNLVLSGQLRLQAAPKEEQPDPAPANRAQRRAAAAKKKTAKKKPRAKPKPKR